MVMNTDEISLAKKELIRLYEIITMKPTDERYGARYNQAKRDAYKLLINLYNKHFGTFDVNNSSCSTCYKKFIADVKKLIEKWQTEEK